MDYHAIGACILQMRRYFGLTQDELAVRLGISRQAVSKWENGAGLPDVAQLMRLSEICGVTVDDILRANAGAVSSHEDALFSCVVREKKRVTVIGAGRWGCFLAWYAARLGHEVTLVGHPESVNFAQLYRTRTSGSVVLPESVVLTDNLATAATADFLLLAVPSQKLADMAECLAALPLRGRTVVVCMKGIDVSSGRRLSQVVTDAVAASNNAAVWVGPGHPEEFLRGVSNCMVVDAAKELVKRDVVHAFSSDLIRFYYGRDLVGSEIGAAAKNVIGIAAGMLDGLSLSTLKGALMSRGTREVARLIVAMGGDGASAYGLCHLGDYEATLFSPHSRNRAYGEAVARGAPFAELAEGRDTARALRNLSVNHGVDMPICRAVYRVLFEGASPSDALDALFGRALKDEF